MPQYEICYLDHADKLLGTHSAPCADNKHARILAHAMRLSGTKRIEVWCGATLVYERPATQHVMIAEPQPPLHAAG